MLWVTRLSVVMLSNVISAFYKVFGQTFIKDDKFLSVVGSISSVFNCSGRLLWGLVMDRFSYKVSMSIESAILVILTSTFYLTSMIGVSNVHDLGCHEHITYNLTKISPSMRQAQLCASELPTTLTTKAVYAAWVWSIFLTFSGTFSMQPAVTTQIFGHRYGGSIYAFLFSSDLINNLLVATLSTPIKEAYGWLGLFLAISVSGVVAFIASICFSNQASSKTTAREKMIQ